MQSVINRLRVFFHTLLIGHWWCFDHGNWLRIGFFIVLLLVLLLVLPSQCLLANVLERNENPRGRIRLARQIRAVRHAVVPDRHRAILPYPASSPHVSERRARTAPRQSKSQSERHARTATRLLVPVDLLP